MSRLLFFLSALLLVCVGVVHAAPLRVTVLLAEDLPAYRDFALAYAVDAARQELPISVMQASSLTQETDLVIAVGGKSAALAHNVQIPTLCVLLPKSGFDKLQSEASQRRDKSTFTAVYLDQPAIRHFALIATVLPNAKKVGVLYSTLPPDFSGISKSVLGNRFTLNAQHSRSTEDLYRDLQSVLQNTDVLLALPDGALYNANTLRNVLLETYRQNVPVIGFSAAFVRAGAVAAVFSTPEKTAVQALSLTRQFVQDGRLSAPQYPNDFDALMNQQVARSLGIPFTESADLVRKIKNIGGAR